MKNKSIFIGMPCLGGINPEVSDSMLQNTLSFVSENYSDTKDIKNKVEIKSISGSLVYDARKLLVQTFLEESDKTHFFFWDSDIILYDGTLNKLIDLDLDVVSIVYYSKKPPYAPVFGAERIEVSDTKIGTRLVTSNAYIQYETQEVWGVGLGGCLIKREVLSKMMDEYDNPFFPFKELGEDYAFCERLREQEYKVNIAPKIRTFHMGTQVFQVDDYEKQLKLFMAHRMNEEGKRMREEQDSNGK